MASSLFEVKECARLGSPKAEILFQENQEEKEGKEHNGNRNFQELNFTSRSWISLPGVEFHFQELNDCKWCHLTIHALGRYSQIFLGRIHFAWPKALLWLGATWSYLSLGSITYTRLRMIWKPGCLDYLILLNFCFSIVNLFFHYFFVFSFIYDFLFLPSPFVLFLCFFFLFSFRQV